VSLKGHSFGDLSGALVSFLFQFLFLPHPLFFFFTLRIKKNMATLVLPTPPSGPAVRAGPKDSVQDQKEAAKERRHAIVDEERDKRRDHEKAKKKLRLIAIQKCKSETESAKALDEINQMTPEQANSRLDVLMARADLTLVDKMAASLKNGLAISWIWVSRLVVVSRPGSKRTRPYNRHS
jgi:hypothetical protein